MTVSKRLAAIALASGLCAALLPGGAARADNFLDGLNLQQRGAVMWALEHARKQSKRCFPDGTGTPGGFVMLDVTIDGGSGKVSAAALAPPLAGTPMEACVKAIYLGADTGAFDGPPRTTTFGFRPRD